MPPIGSSADNREIVEAGRDRSIRVDRHMGGLVHREIVAWPLTDDVEPVLETASHCGRKRSIKLLIPGALFLGPVPAAGPVYALRVKEDMEVPPAGGVKVEMRLDVQVPRESDVFPCAAIRAGNKHGDTN